MAKNVKLSSRANDVMLDWEQVQSLSHDQCYLVALEDWEIALILSVLRYAEWQKRWRNAPADFYHEVTQRVHHLEECLMSGCNVGQLIDVLDLGFAQLHADMAELNGTMAALNGTIEGMSAIQQAQELEDDLANIWAQIQQVTLILGGAIAEVPVPL